MHCPFCKHPESKVVDSRLSEDGFAIRRRRTCPKCEKRFSTLETTALYVQKRNGISEEFSREKLIIGIRKSCNSRPVEEEDIRKVAQKVEEEIRSRGVSQIDSYDVGLALLPFLYELDEVAYLRFASVYKGFEKLADFENEITRIRKARK